MHCPMTLTSTPPTRTATSPPGTTNPPTRTATSPLETTTSGGTGTPYPSGLNILVFHKTLIYALKEMVEQIPLLYLDVQHRWNVLLYVVKERYYSVVVLEE